MDISRTASPAVSESVFSDSALTQLEGDASKPFDLNRLRLERAGSTTSSSGGHDLSNINLVNLSRPWNDDSHQDQHRRGFHAISTVLNHPSKRSAPLRASRIPLPPGPQPEVFPKVNRKDIDAYVKSISPEWDRFEQARSARAGVPTSFDKAAEEGGRLIKPVKDEKDLPKLSLVPEVFFEPDFNIGNPHIFDVVTEQFPPPSFNTSSSINVSTPRKPSFPSSSSPDPSSPSFLPTLNPLPSTSSLPPSPLPSATPRASTFTPRAPPPSSSSASGGGPVEDTTTNQALQDKLNSYLDIVEQHLVLEISRRSSSFFAALTNLQDLQSESSSCLSRIDSLRTELVALDEGQAQRGLEVVRLHRTLGGLKRVEGAVREVRGVEEAVGMIKSLVAAGDGYGAVEIWEEVDGWVKRKGKGKEREQLSINVSEDGAEGGVGGGSGAARRSSSPSSRPSPRNSPRFKPAGLHDLAELPEGDSDELSPLPSSSTASHLVPPPRDSSLSTTQTSPHPHPPPTKHRSSSSASKTSSRYPLTDLTTLSSLSHIPKTLAALALAIATQLESELHAVLVGEMSKPRDPSSLEDGLKGRIAPLVEGLIRVREGGRLVGVYREVAIGEIKEAVKRHMPGGGEGGTEEETGTRGVNGGVVAATKAPLVKALKDLDHAEFLAIEKAMFSGLIACVRTIEVFSKAIESISEDASTLNSSLLSTLPSIKGDLSDVLSTASELANSRASKIIGVRNEQHAALQLGQFLEMFSEAWSFVVACEVICRKMIVGLRGTMVVQAKTFLQTYHSQRVSNSARLVENELWAPEETTPAQQHVVDLLLESAVTDPSELVIISTASSSGPPPPSKPSSTNGTSNGTTPPSTGNKKHLQIEDRSYFVVGATLGTLELLLDYIKIVINIDLLTTDAMSKIIEFLKSFNSRTCQVVLGAGAMRSAGLKNITAKHLALASQSLSIMIALIPYIRETLRRHLNPKQAVMLVEFDKLKRDYQEHQNEIHSKLVAIMGDRLSLHLKALREIEWEAPSRRPGKPNEYIELLVKETTQLHKILSRYLPDQTVESVSSQVFASINHGLSEAYQGIELRSEDAKARLLLDATHLQSKLSILPNTTPISALLVTLVKDKSTPRLPVGASMKMLMRRVSQRSDSGGASSPSGGIEKELVGGRDPELLGGTLGSSGIGTPVSELAGEEKEKVDEADTEGVQVFVSKPEEEEDVKVEEPSASSSPSPEGIQLPPSPLPPLPPLPTPTSPPPLSSSPPPTTTVDDPSSPPPPPPTPYRESALPPIPPKSSSPPSVSSDLPPLPPSSEDPSSTSPPSIPPKESAKGEESELPSIPIEEEEGVTGLVEEGTGEEEEVKEASDLVEDHQDP